MNDEYINISDLKINNVDNHYEGHPVYQIQLDENIDNTIRACIIEVGRFNDKNSIPDIIINKFDISHKEKCIISSNIYHLDDLKDIESTCSFPIIKIIVNHNTGSKLIPIGCMILFFHTFKHLKDNASIENYISTKQDKVWLEGFFSISFHFNDKKTLLENIKDNLGMKDLIGKMIEHLVSDDIRNIVDGLFNE